MRTIGSEWRNLAEGLLRVTGLWSHFACADEPGHPSIAAQLTRFRELVAHAEERGEPWALTGHCSRC